MSRQSIYLDRDARLLHRLCDDEFIASAGIVTSPEALHRWLTRQEIVGLIRRALAGGTLTERQVSEFVDRLFGGFRQGERFPNDVALAAVAVALENRHTDFAEEYLLDLARLNIIEMPFSPKVARICFQRRQTRPRTENKKIKTFSLRKVSETNGSPSATAIGHQTFLPLDQTVVIPLPATIYHPIRTQENANS